MFGEKSKDADVQAVSEQEVAVKQQEPPQTVEHSVDTGSLIGVELVCPIKFKCGGVWYDLAKGKGKVPKAVKEVLIQRGVLKAI